MRISDWSSDVCSSDLRLSRDDPESNLTHLPCYRRIVFFSKITRNDGPKNWVKTGLQLLRQGSHLLRHIINADDIGRGEKAQYCKIEPARTPFHPIGAGAGHILPRSDDHTSELQLLMRISYAFLSLQEKTV